jgi:hypothetical protein
VTNRAGNSRQQQSGGAYDDPDFGRRARIQQQPQQAYQGYQPAQNFMPQPYSQQQFAPALAYPSYPIANPSLSNAPGGGTPILPGNANSSNFAAGPTAAQGIGFGRGRSVAGQQSPPPASAGTTKLKASAPTFNPNAKAFNPSATPTYAPASSAPAASSSYYNTQPLLQPPPSSSQHGIFQFDPATNSFKAKTTAGGATTVPASVAMPAYATPNVYLGGQPNYYLTQQQQHQQGQR